jgi:hypothetical protein
VRLSTGLTLTPGTLSTYVRPTAHIARAIFDPAPAPGDVGGQRSLRPYWRNYFEQTDAIVWIVDSGDRLRMKDCKEELHGLLQEDVRQLHILPAGSWC